MMPDDCEGAFLSSHLDKLSVAEKRLLKLAKPNTDNELWSWILVVCGVRIPRVSVCECHCSPFQWIADSYFDRVQKQIIMGPRGGGKTLNAACINYAELLHKPGVEIASVGAIIKQAKKMYRYLKAFMKDDVEAGICKVPTMEHTDFVSGSRIEVLTGRTKEAVNSPHPHRACIDEYELMRPDILEEALMMPVQTKSRKFSIRLLSTRKSPFGNVQNMMDQADERGYTVYQYCMLDCAEKCTYEYRPSCEPCKSIYKRDQHNIQVAWYDVCRERLRNADGFASVEKLIEDFRGIRYEEFRTQIAPCDKPSRGDAVFSEFSDDLHASQVIDYDPEFPVGSSWDFGINDPNVCLVWQWDGNIIWCIDGVASGELADRSDRKRWMVDDVAREILSRPYGKALLESSENWGDPAGKHRRVYTGIDGLSAFQMLRGLGLRLRCKKFPNPSRRIMAMRLKLRVNEELKSPTLLVSRNVKMLVKAFNFAQWEEGKETYQHDMHSHVLDSAGYIVEALYPPKDHYKEGATNE